MDPIRISGRSKTSAGAVVWQIDTTDIDRLRPGFVNPPDFTRPGVYWYFMDGISREGMTKDPVLMK